MPAAAINLELEGTLTEDDKSSICTGVDKLVGHGGSFSGYLIHPRGAHDNSILFTRQLHISMVTQRPAFSSIPA